METDKQKPVQKKDLWKIIGTMFKWMGKYWPFMILAFVLLYGISYVRTLLPLFGQHIIDVILGSG
ncbi:MAG TPA: hypothetical protein PK113_05030, partial [Bacillota bacterium]|nr:hypothetical protein [Bacillota bacterium]